MQLDNFNFVNAVDLKDCDFFEETLQKFIPTFGCLMSHYKVFKHAIDNRLTEIMVLEDDFCHDTKYRDDIYQYIADIPENYDLVLFGNLIEGSVEFINDIKKINGPFWGTHAYIINENLMIKYINFIENKILRNDLIHSDALLSYLCFYEDLNVFHPKNNLIKQMPFSSLNNHEYLNFLIIDKEIKQKILDHTNDHKLF